MEGEISRASVWAQNQRIERRTGEAVILMDLFRKDYVRRCLHRLAWKLHE